MDLIKLLDVANPKRIKDTINLLITNYEGFDTEIRGIANQALNTANTASQNALKALGQVEENANTLETAINSQNEIIAQNVITSDEAKQIAEEALVIIEQADKRSEEATALAEQAIETAEGAVETSELAMNVATEAKSTVDQAISTGVFGTFVYNTNNVALQRVYATDNVEQENTLEKEYLATPKLVRDAISDLASTTDLALLAEHKAFAILEDYSTSGFFETYSISSVDFWRCSKFNTLSVGDKILCFITRYKTNEQMQLNGLFSCTITSIDEANRIYRVSSKFLKPTSSGPSPSHYPRNIALISDLPTDLADLSQDAEHRLVTDAEKTAWNNKADLTGDNNFIGNQTIIGDITLENMYVSGVISDGTNDIAVGNIASKDVLDSILNNTTFIGPTDIANALCLGKDAKNASYNYNTIIGNSTDVYSVGNTVIGNSAGVNSASNQAVVIGYDAHSTFGSGTIAIGTKSSVENQLGIAIGYNAKSTARLQAIQLGTGTNSKNSTLQVVDDNIYNFETHTLTVNNIADADGTNTISPSQIANKEGKYSTLMSGGNVIVDTRDVNSPPSYYANQQTCYEFKSKDAIGLSTYMPADSYVTLKSVKGWTGEGYIVYQEAISAGNDDNAINASIKCYRYGRNDTWGEWQVVGTFLPYEFNKKLSFGSSGYLYIGKFPIYDTGIFIDISCTTNITYSGKLVIACQNYKIQKASVFGDYANTVTPNIFLKLIDNTVEVYFKPQAWSKNVIHITGCGIRGAVSHVCENISTIPSDATLQPENEYDTNTISMADSSAKWYTRNALQRIFGKLGPIGFLHTLYGGYAGSGNITLSDSYKSYDMLIIMCSADNRANIGAYFLPTWLLDRLIWERSQTGHDGVGIAIGQNYWYIKKSSTVTSFVVSTENSTIEKIYGIKFSELWD